MNKNGGCDKSLCWVWYSWIYTWGIHTSYSTSFRHRFGVGLAMCLQPAGINSWWCEICQCWFDISHKILLQDLFQRWNMGPMVISRVWYSITFQLAQFKWCMHTTFKSDCHPLNCHAFGKLQPSICRSFSSGNCWFSTLILIYWRAYPFISLTYWPSTAGRSI